MYKIKKLSKIIRHLWQILILGNTLAKLEDHGFLFLYISQALYYNMLVQIHLYIFSFHFYHNKTMRSYFCKFCLLHYQNGVFHIICKIHLFDKRCNVSSIQNILDKLPKINKNNIILYNKYKRFLNNANSNFAISL